MIDKEETRKMLEELLGKEKAEQLMARVSDGYEVLINPDSVWVIQGGQTWGSGGYSAGWKVWLGDREQVEVINQKGKENGFMSATEMEIKPKQRPFVISCSEYDCVSRDGVRYFRKFIAIWK